MATLAQLQAEPWWGQEFAPPSLVNLRSRLLTRWGVSGGAIGIKGDEWHLYGYHRSRDWVRNSAWCTNRTYSVSRTTGDKSGGDGRWLAALDISLPTTQLLQVCQRLDTAVRAGRLEKVTEWYGNVNGDRIVDGYDNIANQFATSDDSHLWHLHISFDRGRVGEDHTDVYSTLTGDDMTTLDDTHKGPDGNPRSYAKMVADLHDHTFWGTYAAGFPKSIQARLAALEAKPPVQSAPVDPAALAEALRSPEVLAAIASAVANKLRDRLAD